ncbi:DUF4920 domain-containing protein [Flavobacterium subsaxonicum]|uniref:DUF4920 domain-containing protein n=1 Tax=Flavobacterium subsaxonicum TaxID=426226 RepID=UPI000409CF24|nr:DUF4920 domain-containing protein [Flavobacterium subsaxonicum]
MKKSFIIAAALLSLAACQKKETTVKTEDTVIEGQTDTVSVDTDTVAAAEEQTPAENVAVTETETTAKPEPVVEVKAAKEVKVDYASFGDKILADNALSKEAMLKKYNSLKAGDTVNIKFKTKIKDVCKKKGCWMALQLPGEKESFVKFKDYAFFVPLNATGQDAVVSGKAFVSEVSVAQLRHYAKDGGKTEAEISKITEPEITYGFLADGVLISK